MKKTQKNEMEFHGWKVYKLNGYWNCKPWNCDYPVQSFIHVIDALIYAKQHPITILHSLKKRTAEFVIGQMLLAREIRKARKSGRVYSADGKGWEAKYLD